MRHQLNKKIFFSQSDLAGFMFFSKAFELSHETIEDFISTTKIGWEGWFKNPNFKIPIRNAQANYFAPIIPGQIIKIELDIKKTTETSIVFISQFFHNNALCCEVETVHCFVDKTMTKKIPIPNSILEALNL